MSQEITFFALSEDLLLINCLLDRWKERRGFFVWGRAEGEGVGGQPTTPCWFNHNHHESIDVYQTHFKWLGLGGVWHPLETGQLNKQEGVEWKWWGDSMWAQFGKLEWGVIFLRLREGI